MRRYRPIYRSRYKKQTKNNISIKKNTDYELAQLKLDHEIFDKKSEKEELENKEVVAKKYVFCKNNKALIRLMPVYDAGMEIIGAYRIHVRDRNRETVKTIGVIKKRLSSQSSTWKNYFWDIDASVLVELIYQVLSLIEPRSLVNMIDIINNRTMEIKNERNKFKF